MEKFTKIISIKKFSGETIALSFVFFLLFVGSNCRQKPIEMRALLPNNAVVYLEIQDLSKVLTSLTESRAFQELAAEKPDFSALENIQIAVAVTNFETSEENAVLNFKPRFVAVAETHLWSWQTASFVETRLDQFVKKNYGAETKLEIVQKNDGKFYKWKAADARQVFAFTRGSLIYFGTDSAAIEQSSEVNANQTKSLLQSESLTRVYEKNNLAFGYVSAEGIAQIADLAGVSAALETTEESNGRTFIARALPEILKKTAKEIVWKANKTERGLEDNFSVTLASEDVSVLKQTLATKPPTNDLIEFLPTDVFSATRYNLKNPLVAWRGILLTTAQKIDAVSGRFLIEFSDNLLAPYGIANAEDFLSSIEGEIITARFDAETEQSAVVAAIKDREKLKKSVSGEINFNAAPEKNFNAEIWRSIDGNLSAAFVENALILGESESVAKCLQAKMSRKDALGNALFQKFATSRVAAATFAEDADSAENIVGVLGKKKNENRKLATFYLTETDLTADGFERKTVSDFGLIGTIISQLK